MAPAHARIAGEGIETMAARVLKARKVIKLKLVREILNGEPYEYYPLGKYLGAAPGVCDGRPTIKYHRLDARHIIGFLERGVTPPQIARNYHIPVAACVKQLSLHRSTTMRRVMHDRA